MAPSKTSHTKCYACMYVHFIRALSLTNWSCLPDIICSVALALRVDIVTPAATRRLQQTFICCVCPSVRLSVCPSVHLSVCPSVRLSVCPSVRLSVCPSVRLSVCPSFRLSLCPSVTLSLCHSVSLSVGRD